MRQRHKGLARDAVTMSTPRRPATKKGLGEQIAKATPPPPNPAKINFLAAFTLRALTGIGFIPNDRAQSVRRREARVYAGTVPQHVIAKRRAANKRARAARRVHRQAAGR
jgi:hypothetical protein